MNKYKKTKKKNLIGIIVITKLELSIKLEKDFQKRMEEKAKLWDFIQALSIIEEASKLIDDSAQIRDLYNRIIEPFNTVEDKNGKDSKDSNN